MSAVGEAMAKVVGDAHVTVGAGVADDYAHDECLTTPGCVPAAVVRPADADEVSAVVRVALELGVPLPGPGLRHRPVGCLRPGGGGRRGLLRAHGRHPRHRRAEPRGGGAAGGAARKTLDEALAPLGLVYPVFPGELSASLGGNVATNAGGMRAVRHGVTRHHVLGLQAVLGTGEVIRTGGRFVKATAGYDLTQLVVGSKGTLALVCEATLRLQPRPQHAVTLLAPFATLDQVAGAVPPVVASGLAADGRVHRPADHGGDHRQCRHRAGDPGRRAGGGPGVPGGGPRQPPRGPGWPRMPKRWPSSSTGWVPSTCTCCRPPPGPSSSRPGSTPSGRPRRRGPTTSSTWWCPAPPSPSTWAPSANWPPVGPRWWSAAGTPATATSTSPSARRRGAPPAGRRHHRHRHRLRRGRVRRARHRSGEEGVLPGHRGPGEGGAHAPDQGRLRPGGRPQPGRRLRLRATTTSVPTGGGGPPHTTENPHTTDKETTT